MDAHAQQLVRLSELMRVSAGVLRDLITVRNFDGESGTLDNVADELERLAVEIHRIGKSGLPI